MALLMRIFATGMLLLFTIAGKADEQPDPQFEVTQVAPGLYMLSGVGGFVGGNIGLSIGPDGVVIIDDAMPPFLDKLTAKIKTVTQQPLDFLINTHVHGDHTGNNATLGKQGVRIVAHKNLRQHMVSKGIPGVDGVIDAPSEALPVITFSEEMTFYLNNNTANVFHVAHAHTDGDAVIHFRNLNVIHTGDVLFNGLFPFIDLQSGGSIDGYIAGQKQILAKADNGTKIIPGHGPLASKADLEAAISMLEETRDIVAKLVADGKSEEEVVKLNPLTKYEKWSWGFINTEGMTRQLYKGLKQAM
ncbi:MBL fold metallo-hydrolase [Sedimenticola sp.]|uniref:MBL fold metallo-hydrolase n=1 Tax=Sedimenticola sp. TaxID=1940285 RepID=UPI003D1344DD